MTTVYSVGPDNGTEKLSLVACKNEDRELQRMLEMNANLLPGDQIDPEAPRRWLLIKREMPTPNLATGADQWSLDFLYADQDAIPTLVECKRYEDTGSRRMVVGQLLEYAANGYKGWAPELVRKYAEKSAAARNTTLEQALSALQPEEPDVDGFFNRFHSNLKNRQLRIIFFLERAPEELRSIVDFLNTEMQHAEALIVEARQYESAAGARIVIPRLFGYTETAREVKQEVRAKSTSTSKKWTEPEYFSRVRETLADQPAVVNALERLYSESKALGCNVTFGKSPNRGSFNIKTPASGTRSLLTAYSDGVLVANFGWLDAPICDRLRDALTSIAALQVPEKYHDLWQAYPPQTWTPQIDRLCDVLKLLVDGSTGNRFDAA